jgi:hypothetical protein
MPSSLDETALRTTPATRSAPRFRTSFVHKPRTSEPPTSDPPTGDPIDDPARRPAVARGLNEETDLAVLAAIERAVTLYRESKMTVVEITRETGVHHKRILAASDRRCDEAGQPRFRRAAPSRTAAPAGREAPLGALVTRLWSAAERQVSEIEARFALPGAAAGDPERNARALAVLSRVVRELHRAAADPGPGRASPSSAEPEDDDDAPPRDLDALRDELARRLARLRAERAAAESAGDVPGD